MGKLNKGLTYQNIYQPHGAIEGRLIELRPWHRAMARAVVSGTRPTDLSILFNMTPTQISNITGSPAFLEYLASLERGAEMAATELRQDILNMAQRALEVIDEDLDLSPTDPRERKIRQAAAFEVLDRAIPKNNPVREVTNNQYNIGKINVNKMTDEELSLEVLNMIEDEDGYVPDQS